MFSSSMISESSVWTDGSRWICAACWFFKKPQKLLRVIMWWCHVQQACSSFILMWRRNEPWTHHDVFTAWRKVRMSVTVNTTLFVQQTKAISHQIDVKFLTNMYQNLILSLVNRVRTVFLLAGSVRRPTCSTQFHVTICSSY